PGAELPVAGVQCVDGLSQVESAQGTDQVDGLDPAAGQEQVVDLALLALLPRCGLLPGLVLGNDTFDRIRGPPCDGLARVLVDQDRPMPYPHVADVSTAQVGGGLPVEHPACRK